jgi:uncharacterized protein (DUF58 family)
MARRIPLHHAATPVRRRPSLDFSITGLVYCSMMMFMGLAAVNTQANLLFGVFGLMIGVLVVAGMISRVVLRRLKVRRLLPEHAVVGKPIALMYEFTNTKRFWPSFSVTLGELDAAEAFVKQPLAYMLHTAPRTTANVPTEVLPKRRGLHVFDRYQLSTSFPFGFIKRALDRREHETVLIFPALAQVDPKLLQLCRSADRSGATMRPRRGGDDEFYGVKEFRQGENPRAIYWRRSARTGVLVAKEMTQVSPPKLMLVVDTFLRDRSVAEHVGVEKAVAMATSLASHALEAGLMVGVFAWGGPFDATSNAASTKAGANGRRENSAAPRAGATSSNGAGNGNGAPAGDWLGISPNRGKRHRVDVLAQLAQLPLNTVKDTQALLDASREWLQSGATPILITPREIQVGLSEQARSSLVVLSAAQSEKWFSFDPGIDFSRSMPWNQQPEGDGEEQSDSPSRPADPKSRVERTDSVVTPSPTRSVS